MVLRTIYYVWIDFVENIPLFVVSFSILDVHPLSSSHMMIWTLFNLGTPSSHEAHTFLANSI